jgi:hypothetical protein
MRLSTRIRLPEEQAMQRGRSLYGVAMPQLIERHVATSCLTGELTFVQRFTCTSTIRACTWYVIMFARHHPRCTLRDEVFSQRSFDEAMQKKTQRERVWFHKASNVERATVIRERSGVPRCEVQGRRTQGSSQRRRSPGEPGLARPLLDRLSIGDLSACDITSQGQFWKWAVRQD